MAAPISKTPLDVNGIWVLNRQLSDDLEEMLIMQDVSWVIRKVLKLASMTLYMRQTPGSPPTIVQKQKIHPGGFNGEETLVLDGKMRDTWLPIFGKVSVGAKYTALEDVEDAELRDQLTQHNGADTVIQEVTVSRHGDWTSVLTWGFEEVGGARRYTQTGIVSRKEDRAVARLVFDFLGETG